MLQRCQTGGNSAFTRGGGLQRKRHVPIAGERLRAGLDPTYEEIRGGGLEFRQQGRGDRALCVGHGEAARQRCKLTPPAASPLMLVLTWPEAVPDEVQAIDVEVHVVQARAAA